jgi:hypothetical protein
MSRGSLCAVSFEQKEKPSRPACAPRHACSQCTRARFQGASRFHHAPERRAGKQCSQYLQGVQTCIYSAAIIRLQCVLWTTRLTPLQCQVTRQHDVTLLTEFNVVSDKTRRAHTVEDIICYSYPLVPYCIGFYLPRGYLSDLGSHCNCPTLRYKRPG